MLSIAQRQAEPRVLILLIFHTKVLIHFSFTTQLGYKFLSIGNLGRSLRTKKVYEIIWQNQHKVNSLRSGRRCAIAKLHAKHATALSYSLRSWESQFGVNDPRLYFLSEYSLPCLPPFPLLPPLSSALSSQIELYFGVSHDMIITLISIASISTFSTRH